MYAEVIVDVNNHSVNQSFYYLIPEKFNERNLIGYRVEVPFGTRVVQGYVVNVSKKYNGEYDKNNFKVLYHFNTFNLTFIKSNIGMFIGLNCDLII